jgi:hypothetical protein
MHRSVAPHLMLAATTCLILIGCLVEEVRLTLCFVERVDISRINLHHLIWNAAFPVALSLLFQIPVTISKASNTRAFSAISTATSSLALFAAAAVLVNIAIQSRASICELLSSGRFDSAGETMLIVLAVLLILWLVSSFFVAIFSL